MRRSTALAAAMMALPAGGALAQTTAAPPWPIAADIPKPALVALGLAGESIDITRYLMARGARAPQLSPDGQTVAYL